MPVEAIRSKAPDFETSEAAFHILTEAISKVAGLGFTSSAVRNANGTYNVAVEKMVGEEPESCSCPDFTIIPQAPDACELGKALAQARAAENPATLPHIPTV